MDEQRGGESNVAEAALDLDSLAAAVQRGQEVFREALAPYQAWLRKNGPKLTRVAHRMAEALEYWERTAPTALREAVRETGYLVPATRISLDDAARVVRLFREEGRAAALAEVARLYDEIFEAPDFFEQVSSDWFALPILNRRRLVLADAIEAHRLGLFGVSVPTLLAQAEGIVAELGNFTGHLRSDRIKEILRSKTDDDSWLQPMIMDFMTSTLLVQFEHGVEPMPTMSRHAILHGADLAYGTETFSRTAILWIDQLASISRRLGDVDTART